MVLILTLGLSMQVTAQGKSRAEIGEKYKWRVADLYETDIYRKLTKTPIVGVLRRKFPLSKGALINEIERLYWYYYRHINVNYISEKDKDETNCTSPLIDSPQNPLQRDSKPITNAEPNTPE